MVVLLLGPALALAAEDEVRISTGLDFSSGTYGGQMATETWYLPVMFRYTHGRANVKLTVPYIRTSGPGDVIGVGPDRIPVPSDAKVRRTAEGVGDTVLGVGYALLDGQVAGLLVDVVGKVKFPTADKDKGLGTGETDYSVQLDLARIVGHASVFGTVRWKKYGDPPGRDFRDPLYLSLGTGYRVRAGLTAGVVYDWREKVSTTGSEMSELSAFVSYRLDTRWKLQVYTIRGFSDASPDWGGGVLVHRVLD
ncbi:hypothetical protein G3580_07000 [Nitrogeniibacter mangrovi]|uniref:Transporter n=1 Tax=Nitrogeniibacter mangrovi TaxID=2016596 RepID=A0A6C1B3I3_9RHOO|nr:transporter [Nitrogeniibacter mangrovi]QID17415.1 hypothetical protein G3580_07000 [Nitrogeniibacter mangrovi]